MSPMLGLRTTIYKVGDLLAAKDWYSRAFQTQPYFDEPFYLGFNIGGYELGLLPEVEPTSDKAESVLTYWGVEQIEEEEGLYLVFQNGDTLYFTIKGCLRSVFKCFEMDKQQFFICNDGTIIVAVNEPTNTG